MIIVTVYMKWRPKTGKSIFFQNFLKKKRDYEKGGYKYFTQ